MKSRSGVAAGARGIARSAPAPPLRDRGLASPDDAASEWNRATQAGMHGGVLHPIRIAPSLLAADFAQLGQEVRSVEAAGADWLHLDVMDGHFVPNLTFGPFVSTAIQRVATRPLDVHLMITDPWRYCDAFLDAGAAWLTFHVEVADRGDPLALIDRIHARGRKAGMSLQPDTDVARLQPFVARLDLVLVMSVFAGFGGQKFMPDVLTKIAALRRMGFAGEVSIDGGIGPTTIAAAAAAGANVFVAGTAVFAAPDRAARIAELRRLAAAGRTEALGSSG